MGKVTRSKSSRAKTRVSSLKISSSFEFRAQLVPTISSLVILWELETNHESPFFNPFMKMWNILEGNDEAEATLRVQAAEEAEDCDSHRGHALTNRGGRGGEESILLYLRLSRYGSLMNEQQVCKISDYVGWVSHLVYVVSTQSFPKYLLSWF